MEDLDPEFVKIVNDNFWDLLDNKQPVQSADEFYRKRLIELSDSKIMEKINAVVDISKPVRIMEEYAEKAQDYVYEIYSKPFDELTPLIKIWQEETGKNLTHPDTTQLIKWAVNKILELKKEIEKCSKVRDKSEQNCNKVSDEEIFKASIKRHLGINLKSKAMRLGFYDGAKWMRDKLTK